MEKSKEIADLEMVKTFLVALGYTIRRNDTPTTIVEEIVRPDGTVAIRAERLKR